MYEVCPIWISMFDSLKESIRCNSRRRTIVEYMWSHSVFFIMMSSGLLSFYQTPTHKKKKNYYGGLRQHEIGKTPAQYLPQSPSRPSWSKKDPKNTVDHIWTIHEYFIKGNSTILGWRIKNAYYLIWSLLPNKGRYQQHVLDEGGTTSAAPLFRTFSMNFTNCFFFSSSLCRLSCRIWAPCNAWGL